MRGRLATPVSWQCDRNPLMNTDLSVGASVKFNWAQTPEFTFPARRYLGRASVCAVELGFEVADAVICPAGIFWPAMRNFCGS
jgi:hypothetical protein